MLSLKQKHAFQKNGYVVIEDAFSLAQMNELRQAALDIVDQFDAESTRATFSTKESYTNQQDYFLSSDDKVRCFFEEEAFDDNGHLTQQKLLSINKIGHALHNLNPTFKQFSQSADIANIARDLGVVAPEIRQSMYIFKQPRIGGEVRWHQDATYFYTTPQSVVTFWLAIEDANLNNGCLQVAPNGATYPLQEQFKRFEDNTTNLEQLTDVTWPADETAVPLEVKAGTLVVFNGVLPHFSSANRSNTSRHAFTLHITCAQSEYHEHNWLKAPPMRLQVNNT
ncbi:phytanoyl-CoA dioxygenase family protein [Alteromonas sediminis]|uniref:Phytanoyl-CoA dioxygenase family protein n=1 Tax=Alteromonas sediminis TaxID=2259342 RepID=A0A3N5XX86_9ALTE|nr:phytanoyl-CoA dioxygenase family protein [Alteromonas sediminis]RPJ65120.1 phytanoyl-CoA dioxygenase family protein [Alteromonas sediminis]